MITAELYLDGKYLCYSDHHPDKLKNTLHLTSFE